MTDGLPVAKYVRILGNVRLAKGCLERLWYTFKECCGRLGQDVSIMVYGKSCIESGADTPLAHRRPGK